MKKRLLLGTLLIGTTLAYSKVYIYKADNNITTNNHQVKQKTVSIETKIDGNLITILPKEGEMIEDRGSKNLKTYISDRIENNSIKLNNLKINFCGQKTYILSIGINDYKASRIKLINAVSDSIHMAGVFSKNCKNTISYVVKNATKREIIKNLKDILKRTTPNDSFIFYVSSHGTMINNKTYIIPSDTNIQDKSTLLDISEIKDILKSTNIKSGIMIFDIGRCKTNFSR